MESLSSLEEDAARDACTYAMQMIGFADRNGSIVHGFRNVFSRSPEIARTVGLLLRLDPEICAGICKDYSQTAASARPWVVSEQFSNQNCVLAQAYQFHIDGHPRVRVKQVGDSLAALGRALTNPSWIVRHFEGLTEPLVKVIEEASGRRSMLFSLTDEGIRQGKLLHDLATKVPKSTGRSTT